MDLRKRVDGLKDDLLGELEEFLRMPSISAQKDGGASFREFAEWVAGKLQEAGAETRILETEGHPVVYAHSSDLEFKPFADENPRFFLTRWKK